MKYALFIFAIVMTFVACENHQNQTFQVIQPADPELNKKVQVYIPRLIRACPGLNRYSKDLTPAKVEKTSMRDYEGGIELMFQVVQKPQELPPPLNVRSAQHNCFITISEDGSRAYIAKRACHSICEGSWQENSLNLMGREFELH